MRVVSNTSPICNLAAIDQLHLLRDQFDRVLIPNAVHDELLPISNRPEWGAIARALEEEWLSVLPVEDRDTVNALTLDLDLGESEAIALALQLELPTVLIDESDGRTIAARMGLQPTGVLGVLLKAKAQGKLDSVRSAMIDLRRKGGFFIHSKLFAEIVRLAGEEDTES